MAAPIVSVGVVTGIRASSAIASGRSPRTQISFVPPAEQHLLRILLMGQHVRVRQ